MYHLTANITQKEAGVKAKVEICYKYKAQKSKYDIVHISAETYNRVFDSLTS